MTENSSTRLAAGEASARKKGDSSISSTRWNRRQLIAAVVTAAALMLPTSAFAGWLQFYNGDLSPGQNAQTSSHQIRFDKLMGWVNENDCAKMWYRNNGSIVDYYVVQECDGFISDGRQSTGSAWTYCRNPSPFTINVDCYSCINDECYA